MQKVIIFLHTLRYYKHTYRMNRPYVTSDEAAVCFQTDFSMYFNELIITSGLYINCPLQISIRKFLFSSLSVEGFNKNPLRYYPEKTDS